MQSRFVKLKVASMFAPNIVLHIQYIYVYMDPVKSGHLDKPRHVFHWQLARDAGPQRMMMMRMEPMMMMMKLEAQLTSCASDDCFPRILGFYFLDS